MGFGSILGAVASIGGGILDMFGKEEEAEQQSGAALQNAAAMKKEAEYQKWRTSVQIKRLTEDKDALIAQQRVRFAKAGIVVDEGTAMDVILESARRYDSDKEMLKKEGKFNVERAKLGAKSYLKEADDIEDANFYRTAGTLMQTAQTVSQYF